MKQDISLIDPNFLARSPLTTEFDWYDITRAPMEIRGLALHQGDMFCRLPKELLPQMSEGVQALSYHTAGGRVRFRTNAPKIALRVCSRYANMMSHMPLTGSAGVDVYINGRFQGSVRPSGDRAGWYEGVVLDPYIPQPGAPAGSVYPGAREGLQDVEINLPLYNGLTHMLVGIPKGCTPEPPRPYALDTPIVYYGSSITQAGCASRPGNSYQSHISRWLEADYINLGFSGNARGEKEMAAYIASLPMSAFVCDYDHNAPSYQHLQETHAPLYRAVRTAHPHIPIVFITRPDTDSPVYAAMEEGYIRKCYDVIYGTHREALDAGDTNVCFIDGSSLFGSEDRDACTVDGCHPNDLGFYRMAKAIYPCLIERLRNNKPVQFS